MIQQPRRCSVRRPREALIPLVQGRAHPLTHAENPPGSARMAQLRSTIEYTYEDRSRGGRVRIRSSNPDAVRAVHEFLHYQIREHHTADVESAPK